MWRRDCVSGNSIRFQCFLYFKKIGVDVFLDKFKTMISSATPTPPPRLKPTPKPTPTPKPKPKPNRSPNRSPNPNLEGELILGYPVS